MDAGALHALCGRQHGIITRAQALAVGMSSGALRARLRFGHWQRVHPAVFATFTGPLPRLARLWAAVLAAGAGAVLSHQTAAQLWGFDTVDGSADPYRPIHVTVPRRIAPIEGLTIHQSRRAPGSRHPVAEPPRTRVEETVLDLTQVARDVEEAYGWIARAVSRRLTTPDHLLRAIAERPKVRWRRELHEGLGDVGAGAHSVLERGYLREVERAHGLPTAERQVAAGHRGGRNYLDARYRDYATRVELDGRAYHPFEQRFRDARRDNAGALAGDAPLRYGAADVRHRPCQVAEEVAHILRQRGWTGRPRRCSRPGCSIA